MLGSFAALRVCDFFKCSEIWCCKQCSYGDENRKKSKKSQPLRMTPLSTESRARTKKDKATANTHRELPHICQRQANMGHPREEDRNVFPARPAHRDDDGTAGGVAGAAGRFAVRGRAKSATFAQGRQISVTGYLGHRPPQILVLIPGSPASELSA